MGDGQVAGYTVRTGQRHVVGHVAEQAKAQQDEA